MAPSRLLFPLSLPIALASGGVALAQEVDYRCERSSVQRSVAIEYQDPDRRVPCEVVYHKPPQDPQVLWTARTEVGFCESKAQDLLGTLEQAGWTCTALGDELQPAPAAGPPRSREPANGGVPAADAPTPEVENAALDAAVARDLAKLDRSTEAKVVADSTGYGDLNSDGEADAAVVISFDAGGDDYVQYLVAYVSGDDTYRPVASRLLGGRGREVYGGEVERIEDETILIDLEVLEPGDPSCCPSGSRKTAYVLQDGKLVEAGQSTAGRVREEP